MIALVLAGLLASQSGERILIDRIVATVNGEIVTWGELREASRPFLARNATPEKRKRLYRDILDQLVAERLIDQQIREANITVTDDEVTAAIDDILKQNNISRGQLLDALEARGKDIRDYREELRDQLVRLKLIDMRVRSRVRIKEEDIRLEYERRTRNEKPITTVRLAHIHLRFEEDAAEEVRDEVLRRAALVRERVTSGGEAFAEVAKELSQGPTASRGGGLGEIEEKTLMPAFKRAVADLDSGEISQPVLTPNGVHLLLLMERKSSPRSSYEEMRPKIYQELYRSRLDEQMKLWLDELRRGGAVEIRFEQEQQQP